MRSLSDWFKIGVCVLVVIVLGGTFGIASANWEIDASATVTRVIDGDTFDALSIGRIRLADIDAPEIGEAGASDATVHLASLIGRRLVHLDVDDLSTTDRYGRTVAVVYVRHNETHLLNVNAAQLHAGLVNVADYPNEFAPSEWSEYVALPDSDPGRLAPLVWTTVGAAAIMLVAVLTAWGVRRAARRREDRGVEREMDEC